MKNIKKNPATLLNNNFFGIPPKIIIHNFLKFPKTHLMFILLVLIL